ncbi:hypothetical protein [Microcella sp.]|uniref:hypothetical protein n=1 Tax=Microcella sp. TaxID=1913979 RepID=UPI00299F62AD|nr:hypothetical protein [Microcella sp.]MDX2026912.1 hypothetical protein [Microcella sp.]
MLDIVVRGRVLVEGFSTSALASDALRTTRGGAVATQSIDRSLVTGVRESRPNE